MKVIEILKFNRELLERIYKSGIRLEDVRYIDLYTEYMDMRDKGEKVTYIIALLADRYSVSERKIYSLIRHLQTDCTSHAV